MVDILIELKEDGLKIPILYRKHRGAKQLRLTIKGQSARLTVPWGVSKTDALAFVKANQKWVFEQVNRYLHDNQEKCFQPGRDILYLGRYFPCRVQVAAAKINIELQEEEFLLSVPADTPDSELAAELITWYKREAKLIFGEKLAHFAVQMGVTFNQYRIKEQKTRWGSCSSKGNINLNWRAVLAPPAIIDYLIVHELAHLKHLNHSRQFWQLVEQYKPDFLKCRNWLTKHGKQLMLEI